MNRRWFIRSVAGAVLAGTATVYGLLPAKAELISKARIADCNPTLAQWARENDPNGRISAIADLLSSCNEVVDDMVQGPAERNHRAVVRTKLPDVKWRSISSGNGG
jgi:hypothetical protein